MPHISRIKLNQKVINILERHIDSVIRDAGTKTRSQIFDELLTPTEKIMLAKRLGILFLLKKGASIRVVGKLLGVSLSTINRFRNAVRVHRYNRTTDWVWKQGKEGKFDALMESLVSLVFTGRTKSFKKFIDEY